MTRADFKVVIDSCVLVNFPACDLLLRLAEPPRLFLPRWSKAILRETSKAQTGKLGWPPALVESFRKELSLAFPDAETNDYTHIIPVLTNHEKDRHVLACAIRAGAGLILTFNTKDFPRPALEPWRVEAKHPQDYLLDLYSMEPQVVIRKLAEIAREKNRPLEDHLLLIGKSLPAFSSYLIQDLEIDL